MANARGILGILALLLIAWLLSSDRRRIPVKTVVGGMILQWALALLVLKTGPGKAFFEALGNVGGVKYLTNLARTQPKVFVPALVRLLPTELSGPNGGPIQTQQMQDLSKLSDEDLRKLELILAKAAQP